MNILIGKQFAAFYKRFQNAEINFFIRPFTLPEKGSIFILLGKNIDLRLTFFFGIVAPPAAERGKLHWTFSVQQQLPEILLANIFKHFAHIVGQIRLNALVCQIGSATGDDRVVFRGVFLPQAI